MVFGIKKAIKPNKPTVVVTPTPDVSTPKPGVIENSVVTPPSSNDQVPPPSSIDQEPPPSSIINYNYDDGHDKTNNTSTSGTYIMTRQHPQLAFLLILNPRDLPHTHLS